MRDTMTWYLVELRRRLRGHEPLERVEDFLLETRAHLEDAVADMTARGVPEDDAVRSAISDFGHPGVVAASFKGVSRIGPLLYWALVVAVVLALGAMSGQFIQAMSDVALGTGVYRPFGFGLYAGIGLCSVALIGFLSRRWAVVPIALGTMAVVAAWGFAYAVRVQAYGTRGAYVLMDETAAQRQVVLRDRWLNEYEAELRPMLGVAFSGKSRESFLAAIEHEGQYFVPSRGQGWGAEPFRILPRSFSGRRYSTWVSLDRESRSDFLTMEVGDAEVALQRWRDSGAAYAAYARSVKDKVQGERESFLRPFEPARAEEFGSLVGKPLLGLAFYALVAALINAFVIVLRDSTSVLRRLAWKRMLG